MIRQFRIGQTLYNVGEKSEYYTPVTITTITITANNIRYLFDSKRELSEHELNIEIDNDRMFADEIDAIHKNIKNLEGEAKYFNKRIQGKILDKKIIIKNLLSKKS